LHANLYLDFGDGLPAGGLTMTARQLRDTANGPDLSVNRSANLDDNLQFTSLASIVNPSPNTGIDYNGDGAVNAQDVTDLKIAVTTLITRYYAPFDVSIQFAAASSLNDIQTTLLASGENDAYVLITGVTDTTTGGAIPASAYGDSPPNDIGGANNRADTAILYAGNILNDYPNANADTALAHVAAHESGHTFGLAHTYNWNGVNGSGSDRGNNNDLLTQSDIIAQYAYTNHPGLLYGDFFTRFPLVTVNAAGTGPGTALENPYDVLASNLGARAFLANSTSPDYITGTGANDKITLTPAGDLPTVGVVVDAYADAGFSTLISSYSYFASTTNGLVIDTGFGNDQVILNAPINCPITIHGHVGQDQIIVNGTGNETVNYLPEGATESTFFSGGPLYGGTLAVGNTSITFDEFQAGGSITVQNVHGVTFFTPANSSDFLLVTSPAAGQDRVSGFMGGVSFTPLIVANSSYLTLLTGAGDQALPDTVLMNGTVPGIDLTVGTGAGADTIDAENTSSRLTILSGAGNDTITVNGTAQGPPVQVDAGAGDDKITVGNISGPTTILGGAGDDTINVGIAAAQLSFNDVLTVDGEGGFNQLFFNDSANSNNSSTSYTIASNNLTRVGTDVFTSGNQRFFVTHTVSINYSNMEAVAVTGGQSGSTWNVLSTASNSQFPVTTALTCRGDDTVNVGNAGSLSGIQGNLAIADPTRFVTLVVDDSADSTAHTNVAISNTGISGLCVGTIGYQQNDLSALTITGSQGGSTYNVQSTPFNGQFPLAVTLDTGRLDTVTVQNTSSPLAVNSLFVNDTFNVGTASTSLDAIQAAISFNGQSGTDRVYLYDQSALSGQTYTLSGTSLTRGGAASISWGPVAGVVLNASSFSDTINLASLPPASSPVTIHGDGGSDTLVGNNAPNNWYVTGANGGKVGNVTFTAISNLVGGTAADTFKFSPSGSIGTVNGGGGGDWLDYSQIPSSSPVTVNLATGSATGVGGGAAGAVSNIQNVTGGDGNDNLTGNAQGNILQGGPGNDTITGGSGRSLLEGGAGNDTITGGAGDDILIGSTTSFDQDHAVLNSLLREWRRTDKLYAGRVMDLHCGGGLNGNNRLVFGVTVQDDSGAPDVLTGGPGLDWFFQFPGDTITDLNNGGTEEVENGRLATGNTGYVFGLSATTSSQGEAIATDGAGNVYLTGVFTGTINVDRGPGTHDLTSRGIEDTFVAKYSATGSLIWVAQLGGTSTTSDDTFSYDITVDRIGNVYVGGGFYGTTTMGSFTFSTTSPNTDADGFVAKLDSTGNVAWARRMGGSLLDSVYNVAVDSGGNVYVDGAFEGMAAFGRTTLTSVGGDDGFVAKLDSAGTFQWARGFGGSGEDYASGIGLDASGNIYASGAFSGTVAFGGTSLTSAGPQDAFVIKLNNSGTTVAWADQLGGNAYDHGEYLRVDRAGNVFVSGIFGGTDFFFGTGADTFVSKLSSAGTVLWTRQYADSNTDTAPVGLALDASGNVYLAAIFSGTIAFDSTTFTSAGSYDIAVVSLTNGGTVSWARQAGGTGQDGGNQSLAVDGSLNVYMTGIIQGTVNFDPNSSACALTGPAPNNANFDFAAFVWQITQPGPMSFTAPPGSGSASYTLQEHEGYMQLVDNATKTVLTTKALVDTTSVSIKAGPGVNTTLVVDFSGGAITVPVTYAGGTGNNTLVGPNAATTWTINGANTGKAGNITFSAVANLVGGTAVDTFKFSPIGSIGSLNGGGGKDWLDYSLLPSTMPVTVNLATGSATRVGGGTAGALSNIQNVIGGAGNDSLTGNAQGNILIGGAGNDVITGGSGRSLLIGGLGSDTITGGSGDDILIGGITSGLSNAALASILAEWQGKGSYATRIFHLKNGGGLNGSNKLIRGTTVLDDGAAADTLTGAGGLDWFFQFAGDTITDLNNGGSEQIN
jgi:Ca2+-binding RTX toxin-like protein